MEKRLTLIVEKCSKNHVCPPVSVCPAMALEQDEYKAPTIDESKDVYKRQPVTPRKLGAPEASGLTARRELSKVRSMTGVKS